MKKILMGLILLLSPTLFSLENLIGYTPDRVIETLGAPDYVQVIRGEEEKEDDVLFYYNNSVYIYFNGNRVWQMRVDKNYSDIILRLKLGNSRTYVRSLLGEPLDEKDSSYIYRMPDQGYPLILRLYFTEDRVDDIYLYRGDY